MKTDGHSLGFHEGELAVQRRAGVTAQAARLSGMLGRPDLTGGFARFLADRIFAVLTARDAHGRLWTSPLSGSPGFLHVGSPTTLTVRAHPPAGDPLAELPGGQPVGLLAIDVAARRRVRVNGQLVDASDEGLTIAVDQAYGNCPQYIQRRRLTAAPPASPGLTGRHDAPLTAAEVGLITRADTFFVGSTHPTRGADASHRGGPPGFVRATPDSLWWPDYPGNNMFNTLGNLQTDPTVSLLFADFTSGTSVAISGTASVQWTEPGSPGDDGQTGRRVTVTPNHVVCGHALPRQASAASLFEGNPPLS